MALSALLVIETTVSLDPVSLEATPKLAVILMDAELSGSMIIILPTPLRILSANPLACFSVAPGKHTKNSSPPYLPTKSYGLKDSDSLSVNL
jgi:hypothetical protein